MSEPTSEPHRKLNSEEKAFAKRLGSRNLKERQKAEQEVQEIGVAGRDLLLAILRHEEERRKDRRKEIGVRVLIYVLLFGVPALLLSLCQGRYVRLPGMEGQAIGGLLGAVIVSCVISRAEINAAYLLAKHFEDVSIIGPLAEALAYRSKSVREAAATALIRLLPRLQEADADLLTSAQRSRLHRALMGGNPELVMAILCAFEQVGDSQVMPNVQKLASGLGVAGTEQHICDAAQQTLLHLNLRIEAQRAPQILLRAASANAIGGEILLRPAVEVTDTPKYVLLRPINNTNQTNQESGA